MPKSLQIYSWNVNGLRAVIKKGAFESFIEDARPDILCVQETKAKKGQAEIDLPEYEELWNSAERPGYSGTAIFTKIKPLTVSNILPTSKKMADAFGDPLTEGRVLTAEFEWFYLVNVYTPNSKRALERLALRDQLWDPEFLHYLKTLDAEKPVIVCGDFNAAHTAIDLARPTENEGNAGYTAEERRGIDNIMQAGFVDTFRAFYPEATGRYTWWTWRANARAKNIGWRIDYFLVSERLFGNVKSASIHEEILGSDHCPISIEVEC